MNLLIYLPALNEEKNISEVLNKLPKKLEGVNKVSVLVVDDGSTDNTVSMAKKSGAIVISHPRNLGVGRAFHTAIEYARKNSIDILVSIDADKQFDSKEIPTVIKPILDRKADMVAGNRFANGIPKNMSKIKYWGNGMMAKLISFITGKKLIDVSCGFRAYGRKALHSLNLYGNFTYTQETILDLSFKELFVEEIPISVTYYPNRKSRVAGNILNYAFKTSHIIVSFLTIYKPMVLLLLVLSILIVLNLLVLLLFKDKLDVSLILSSILYVHFLVLLIFKNIRRIINNQERILAKQEEYRNERH
ncbi:MAG: family 2 glycosyl transferase [candidate division WS6 bacterium GW2011_GWC1_33_20]|uniref:Glycosyl transferase family 2 n=2 Tax=Candidatus Dojkabacteria TaxID=74243 RepID=A0A0G0AEQ4_9BACT|nr:MAG: family 2 glycosyl transferase [candidate division WS6 bacterium GW2011_GWE2_33_157]KKP43946.1 MAG: family 2 glycosyl transferase [candidate division WS6 bacterium GW2011_GWC1_33_20]KKP45689.1 MAG: family 2 glycosyl transferase [candidate division WS6 bacterium GW2011_GWF1_33_233]KKP55050.1 MAG: family 2 glycosyl transferase [candidate division WS6 bacterium GW2011_WS6_33_547]KKP55249.1 MAG: Glycosyl transferase family 2 [candidate division WS6 bacterium GW2011_GWB1_33_6]KKP56835.1 MAG: